MRKLFKIILAIFAVLIIVIVAFGAIVFLDVAAYTATGSETLTPIGASVGKALVVYNSGLSGATKEVASKIATALQAEGYVVDLAGIKSSTAADTSGYSIIVVGGPIYAGAPTSSVKTFLSNLSPAQGVRIGVFGSGGGPQETNDTTLISKEVAALPSDSPLTLSAVAKIGSGEDLNARSADFVAQLLS
jgi:sulfite reductase alpha subunit-like flavoprotein